MPEHDEYDDVLAREVGAGRADLWREVTTKLYGPKGHPRLEIPWGVKCARCRERQALARKIDGQPVCGHCFYDWLQERDR